MERFLQIDWNPPLEDIIDKVFIQDERLEKQSAMHRILTGTFKDPFKNINEDYQNVKLDLLGAEDDESNEEEDSCKNKDHNSGRSSETGHKSSENKTCKPRTYVPGIVRPTFKFPRNSSLSKEQHAMCLKIMLMFSESDKPKLSQTEREELRKYMQLQQIISKEQDEFLEFAKSQWHTRTFKLMYEDYINLRWKSKLHYITTLPRYYIEVLNVPFVATKDVGIKFVSLCSQMGSLPEIKLPDLIQPHFFQTKLKKLMNRFPPKKHGTHKSSPSYKLPVSKDPHCQKLAEENNIDLIISSSGLNCLVNNIGPKYSNSWILPIVIKRHNDKNVIYIDKPAPPTASTIPEKNTWVFKYVVRESFVKSKEAVKTSSTNDSNIPDDDDNIFGSVNSEELLRLEENHENSVISVNKLQSETPIKSGENRSNALAQTVSVSDMHTYATEKNTDHHEVPCQTTATNNVSDKNSGNEVTVAKADRDVHYRDTKCNQFENSVKKTVGGSSIPTNDNVSYKLFVIGSQSSEQNELMKNAVKDYKILVRSKNDGFEMLDSGERRLLQLAPKLEHQVDLGAEAVTLEEALRQWASLVFRPNTFLARVRIYAQKPEVLQIERRTAMSLNNEIKRLYNVKAEDSLTILHNVVQFLAELSPGQYIMRHTVRNGAFATVYKEANSPGKSVLDLHTVCGTEYFTVPNAPWMSLDKIVVTPTHKCFERMPAMFYPSKMAPGKQKNQRKVIKSNTGAIRRSLRNKQKSKK